MGKHCAVIDHTTRNRVAVIAPAMVGLAAAGVGAANWAAADAVQSDWDVIAKCESGNRNVQNATSSASGYFQIIDGTWRAYGGTEFAPRAIAATYAQQLIVANRIFNARGSFADWNASKGCWGGKVSGANVVAQVPTPAPTEVRNPPDQAITSLDVVVAEPMATEYTVVRGDCLWDIAKRFGIGVTDLYLANRGVVGGNPDLILPGQVLTLTGAQVDTGQHADPGPSHAAPYELPLDPMTITQAFKGDAHRGIDIDGVLGQPGYAVADGTIITAGPASGFGLWVIERVVIDGVTFDLVYGHMNSLIVHSGEAVKAGDQIINVGNNGDVRRGPNGDGSHLHFEVWVGGRVGGHPIDPVGWLRARGLSF